MPHLSSCLFGSSFTANLWANLALTLLRLHVGLSMARGGLDKLPVPDWFVEQVAGMGFPLPAFFALLAALAEFAGGLLLAVGLFTRPAAFFLAFTLGTAAFLFHEVRPLIQLHITQGLFWSYVLFIGTGGGRFALDRLVTRPDAAPSTRRLAMAAAAASLLTGYGLFLQVTSPAPVQEVQSVDNKLTSVSLAGTFNDWDLEATPMSLQENGQWSVAIFCPLPGPIEFKFAADGTWDKNVGESSQAEDKLPLKGVGTPNKEGNPENIRAFIPKAGNYTFTIQPETYDYTVAASYQASPADLLGEWQVDLRPTPDAEPYLQTLSIQEAADGQFTGTFYDSEIQDSQLNQLWGVLHGSFTTSDGTGNYHSTFKYVDGRLEGTTHAPSRKLLSVWTATR